MIFQPSVFSFLCQLKEETTKRSEIETKLSMAEANHAKEIKDIEERLSKAGKLYF